jgi:hypothetical protein
MFAVKDENEVLIITDDLDFAEAYAVNRFNQFNTFVEVVDLSNEKVILSFDVTLSNQ